MAAVRSGLEVWIEGIVKQFHVRTVSSLHIHRHTTQYSKLWGWIETYKSSVLFQCHLDPVRLPKKLRTHRIDNSLSNVCRGSNDPTQRMNSKRRRPRPVSPWQCKPSESTWRRLLMTTQLTLNLQLEPKDNQFKSCLYVGAASRLRSHCPSPENCWHSAVPKVIYKRVPERPQLL